MRLAVFLLVVLLVGIVGFAVATFPRQLEAFKQVAMINNTMPEPEEWPIFYPVPLPPPNLPCVECPEDAPTVPGATPGQVPAGQPVPVGGSTPSKPSTPGTPSSTPTTAAPPAALAASPAKMAASPVAAKPVPVVEPTVPGNPHCVSPKYVVCEVHPAPKVSANAFRLSAVDNVAAKSAIAKWDGFSQGEATKQPMYHVDEGTPMVSYVKYTWQQNMAYDGAAATLDIGKNKGASLVFIGRFVDDFDAFDTYKLLAVGEKYTLTIGDIKYYIIKGKWMFVIKTFAVEDQGVAVRTFINDVDDTEETWVGQRQLEELRMEDADAKDVQLMVGNIGANVDVVYAGVYDRALTAYERKGLIKPSITDILAIPGPTYTPRIIVEYNIEKITPELAKDPRKQFIDSAAGSSSPAPLSYNETTSPAFEVASAPKFLALTKNQRFYSPNPVRLDLSSGYTVELLFSGADFAKENNAVIFTYSTQENAAISGERDIPDIIAQITTVDKSSVRGNLFSVQYAGNLRSFECEEILNENTWYHVVFTSESTMIVNGVKVLPKGKAVANIPTYEGHQRYISIGDRNTVTALQISSDTGRTMVGKYALVRIYDGALTTDAILASYEKWKMASNPYLLP